MAKKKKPDPIPTPEDIRKLRKRLNLTQKEAADKIGVSYRTWVSWENEAENHRKPSRTAVRLIRMLAAGKLY